MGGARAGAALAAARAVVAASEQAKGRRGAVHGALAQRQQGQRLGGLAVAVRQPGRRLETQVGAAKRHGQRGGKGPRILAGTLGEIGVNIRPRHTPHPHGSLRHIEQGLQAVHQGVGQVHGVTHLQQGTGPLVHLGGDGRILVAVAHHFHDAQLQPLDLLAQHFGLAFLQAHGAGSVRAGDLYAGQLGRADTLARRADASLAGKTPAPRCAPAFPPETA